jgi:5-oxoprolinase (ATP-hydrolysing) subunit B
VKHRWITDRGLWLDSGADTLALTRTLQTAGPAEMEAVIPADGSLLVVLKSGMAPGAELLRLIDSKQFVPDTDISGRYHEVVVRYGGVAGPDLGRVAEEARLTVGQAIELHASAEYKVVFLGFQPGFAYLSGTPQQLWTERRATPRTRVPAGSLALGGGYTGLYPSVSPGGWQLIGQTKEWLFDPCRNPPARFALGDHVRFVPK